MKTVEQQNKARLNKKVNQIGGGKGTLRGRMARIARLIGGNGYESFDYSDADAGEPPKDAHW